MSKLPIPKAIIHSRNVWALSSFTTRTAHLSLVVIAISCSLLVSSRLLSPKYPALESWLAFVAALSIGLVNGINLGDKANRFRRGWRKLNTAILKYENEENYLMAQLIKEYE